MFHPHRHGLGDSTHQWQCHRWSIASRAPCCQQQQQPERRWAPRTKHHPSRSTPDQRGSCCSRCRWSTSCCRRCSSRQQSPSCQKPSLPPWPQCFHSHRVKNSCRTDAGRKNQWLRCSTRDHPLRTQRGESVEQKATQRTHGTYCREQCRCCQQLRRPTLRCWQSHQSPS